MDLCTTSTIFTSLVRVNSLLLPHSLQNKAQEIRYSNSGYWRPLLELRRASLTLFVVKLRSSDGKLPPQTATQRHNENVAKNLQERVDRLSQEMVTLHEEWAAIDATQNAASKIAAKPRVGKKIVVN